MRFLPIAFNVGVLVAVTTFAVTTSAQPAPAPPPPPQYTPAPPPQYAPPPPQYTPPPSAPAPPPPTAPESSEDLPLYKPSKEETAQFAPPPPPPPPTPSDPLAVSAIFDAFVFPSGTIRGAGNIVRARFGNSSAAIAGGIYNGGQAFVIGGDFFRYQGVGVTKGPTQIVILVPHVEFNVMSGSSGTAVELGTSATGLRVGLCGVISGCALVFSIRVPTVGVWVGGNGTAFGGVPSVSVGASADLGLAF